MPAILHPLAMDLASINLSHIFAEVLVDDASVSYAPRTKSILFRDVSFVFLSCEFPFYEVLRQAEAELRGRRRQLRRPRGPAQGGDRVLAGGPPCAGRRAVGCRREVLRGDAHADFEGCDVMLQFEVVNGVHINEWYSSWLLWMECSKIHLPFAGILNGEDIAFLQK